MTSLETWDRVTGNCIKYGAGFTKRMRRIEPCAYYYDAQKLRDMAEAYIYYASIIHGLCVGLTHPANSAHENEIMRAYEREKQLRRAYYTACDMVCADAAAVLASVKAIARYERKAETLIRFADNASVCRAWSSEYPV